MQWRPLRKRQRRLLSLNVERLISGGKIEDAYFRNGSAALVRDFRMQSLGYEPVAGVGRRASDCCRHSRGDSAPSIRLISAAPAQPR